MQFVFLPECCDFVGENRQQTLELSLETGKLISKYRDLAKTAGVWLSLGGLHERIEDTDKMYNCHVVINDQGEIAGEYRKLHLFDVDTPEFKFRESDIVSPGPRITPPIDTPIGRLGLQIVRRGKRDPRVIINSLPIFSATTCGSRRQVSCCVRWALMSSRTLQRLHTPQEWHIGRSFCGAGPLRINVLSSPVPRRDGTTRSEGVMVGRW